MPRIPGKLMTEAREARLAAYAAARDEGKESYEAAEIAGVRESTRKAYERWYRARQGLPPRRPGFLK